MSKVWNPWHGCKQISPGCDNCYVYRIDGKHGRDSSQVKKTLNFNLPLKRKRNGTYTIEGNQTVYTCFSSDFFLDVADDWRPEAWEMIRTRKDCDFLIITKRIDRFLVGLPVDWKDGYDNVTICSTVENQERASYRLPILLDLPIKHKMIVCEPLLSHIDLSPYLGPWIELVVVGGESGSEARVCNYDWVLDIRQQCFQKRIPFHFKQTGARFLKEGNLYRINRNLQHQQARKAAIDLDFQ